MDATSNPKPFKCPNCQQTITVPGEEILRRLLRSAGDELTRTKGALETVRRAAASAEAQDADKRAELTQSAHNWEERAREAEKRGAARQAELDALRRGLGDMMKMLELDIKKMQARDQQLKHVRCCLACEYIGELVGDAHANKDEREYCARCGENVMAQHEPAEAAAPAAVDASSAPTEATPAAAEP